MRYYCDHCGFSQEYMLRPSQCRKCSARGTMREGRGTNGFDFHFPSEQAFPHPREYLRLRKKELSPIDPDAVTTEGKSYPLAKLSGFNTVFAEPYLQFIEKHTTYLPTFNRYLLSKPNALCWLNPYTGNQHNRTYFTHLAISAVARTLASQLGRLPWLIEPFAGSGQIFLNSLNNLGTFNGGQPLFSGVIGGDLNHYLIATYRVLISDGENFIDDCKERMAQWDANVTTSFPQALLWLDTHGKAYASSMDLDENAEAALHYIYVVNRCKRTSSLKSNGGISATLDGDKASNLKELRTRGLEILGRVLQMLDSTRCDFFLCDFELTCLRAQPGDLVVMDTPFPKFSYVVESNLEDDLEDSSTYGTGSSGKDLQQRITAVAKDLVRRGVTVVLCNYANAPLVRMYEALGPVINFTYKRPTTDSELYQLAIIPGCIEKVPIDLGPSLKEIQAVWKKVTGEYWTLPLVYSLESLGDHLWKVLKKLGSSSTPFPFLDTPGLTRGSTSQFSIPGGGSACAPMSALAISHLLHNNGSAESGDIDSLLVEGTLLYQEMLVDTGSEHELMEALALSLGNELDTSINEEALHYFNPAEIPGEALQARDLVRESTETLDRGEVLVRLRQLFENRTDVGVTLVLGRYSISITSVGNELVLFDSHGFGDVSQAFFRRFNRNEKGFQGLLELVDRMIQERVSESKDTKRKRSSRLREKNQELEPGEVSLSIFTRDA